MTPLKKRKKRATKRVARRKEREFRVGDRVNLKYESDTRVNGECVIARINYDNDDRNIIVEFIDDLYTKSDRDYGWTRDEDIPSEYKSIGTERYMSTKASELTLLKGGKIAKIKTPKVNFLLKYDLDVDPVEEFETLTAVKKRIKELIKDEDSLKRDSIVVYKVSKKMSVELVDNVVIRGLK